MVVLRLLKQGSASLSNSFYTKPPTWGDAGAWELYDSTEDPTGGSYWIANQSSNGRLSRSGRRIWNLSFSYIGDGDLNPVVHGTNNLLIDSSVYDGLSGTSIWSNSLATDRNIFESDDFYSQVIHKTNGGQLPFIFQPDGGGGVAGQGNFNPDQFAICKFDMKSFKFKQSAYGVYDVSLKIREVW